MPNQNEAKHTRANRMADESSRPQEKEPQSDRSKGALNPDITLLLQEWKQGDQAAFNALIDLVHQKLRAIAHQKLKGEFGPGKMQTTELLNEACLSLLDKQNMDWQNRKHFFYTAGLAMHRLLIDKARQRKTTRHGGDLTKTDMWDDLLDTNQDPDTILAINEALDEIVKMDSLMAEIIKLRYFAGYTIKETASMLDITVNHANRKWRFARAWLQDYLKEKNLAGPDPLDT